MTGAMRWLNYHHLLYFWTVAREGSVTKACKELRLAQPTISAQLKSLEEALGQKLFEKNGRYLKLTEAGKLVFRYADEIFRTGKELLSQLDGKQLNGRATTLRVGVTDVMPKVVVLKLLEPAFKMPDPPKLICYEDRADRLLADLAIHDIDLVISDAPIPSSVKVRAFNHSLGESGLSFVAAQSLAKSLAAGFPQSLSGVAMLLPSHEAAIRREIDYWFQQEKLEPNVVGEFQDSALMEMAGRSMNAVFPVPTCVEKEVCQEQHLEVVGRTQSIKERFYLISAERKVKSPAIAKILEHAGANIS